MTSLYRIRRHHSPQIEFLFIKAESPEDAATKFASIAGLSITDGAGCPSYIDADSFFWLSNETAIVVVESSLDAITKCHPELGR